MGSSRWYISDLHLVTIWMYVVVSLPRIDQVAASSQQKEYMPNSRVMWSLGIECKMNPDQLPKFAQWLTSPAYLCVVSTQIRRVIVGRFTQALYSNHHLSLISLLQITFLFLVLLQWQSRSTACQHPVNVNICVTARLLARQKQVLHDYKLHKSVLGLNNSCYN
jgi:hypothetical protein